ncbi:MAG: sulfotransferase [Burkholderiales bacterium]|nr:sulfotransferase [Burkholderiales bacterium]
MANSTSGQSPQLPLAMRILNRIGRFLSARFALMRFEPQALMARAMRKTGLRDFAPDADFDEGLSVLCQSLEQDVRPSLLGRIFLHDILLRVLSNRLLLVHWRKEKPERFQQPLLAPLIVVGMPRSGTTFLHRLLALAPGARALKMWELQRPLPPRGLDIRRGLALYGMAVLRWVAVDLDRKHFTSADSVEECLFLLDSSMVSLTYWVHSAAYQYLYWFLARDKKPSYELYRQHLSWLQGDTPNARLTLKAPVHTGCLDALKAAVPNAMIVQTHRDPGVVVPSLNSLLLTMHRTMVESAYDLDIKRIAKANTDSLVQMECHSQQVREQLPPGSVFDVQYPELCRDPIGTVRSIYQHFGLEFTAEYEAILQQAIRTDRHEDLGKHRYSAEDFGQNADELRQLFAGLKADKPKP